MMGGIRHYDKLCRKESDKKVFVRFMCNILVIDCDTLLQRVKAVK